MSWRAKFGPRATGWETLLYRILYPRLAGRKNGSLTLAIQVLNTICL